MTVACNFIRCQFNVEGFCSQKLLSIYNGYCLNLIDRHGNPKNDWIDPIGKEYKEEMRIEDGEFRDFKIIKDSCPNANQNDDESKDDVSIN